MGSTVTTGKHASAFTSTTGSVSYVLWEQSFERNVHPHTPSWDCVAFGSIERVMAWVFSAASACVSGMLLGSGGRTITAEGYVAGWLKVLKAPSAMRDMVIDLKAGDSWASPITLSDMPRVNALLLESGRDEMAAKLNAGESVSVSLHADSNLLCSIYDGRHAPAWRVFKSYHRPATALRLPELGYQPCKAKEYELPAPRFMKVHKKHEGFVELGPDGCWRCDGGAEYAYVANYVRELWQSELLEPGSYRSRIKAFRDAIKSAPVVNSAEAVIVFDTTQPIESYQQSRLESILAETPHTIIGNEIHIALPACTDNLSRLTHLPAKAVKWMVTKPAAAATAVQLDLLAD